MTTAATTTTAVVFDDVEQQTYKNTLHSYHHAYPTQEPSNSACSSMRSGRFGKKKKVLLLGAAGIVSLVLVLELIVVIAFAAGPFIGMINSMKTALDVFGGQETQSFQIMLNVDSGANLTQILTDNEGLLAAGAQLLAPPPITTTNTNAAGGETGPALEVRGLTETNATSPDSSATAFVQWCERAPCMQTSTELCMSLDQGLASARAPNGAPVIPLPSQFCEAVDVLSRSLCLCDEDLADPSKTGETASIVKQANMIGTLCRVQMITPKNGKCT